MFLKNCLFHNLIEISLHQQKTQTSPQQSCEEVRNDGLPLKCKESQLFF
jgi:hypothetical protein